MLMLEHCCFGREGYDWWCFNGGTGFAMVDVAVNNFKLVMQLN